jgi:amino-acid N-acetyltransferase
MITFRSTTAADAASIRALVRSERLNPNGLHWPNFVVATDADGLVGAAQIRRHRDGSRELGSLVVREGLRGNGIAAQLIELLLAAETSPVHMITDRSFTAHYRRWGFHEIEARDAPAAVRFNYRMGRLARLISWLKGLPPKRLTALERGGLIPSNTNQAATSGAGLNECRAAALKAMRSFVVVKRRKAARPCGCRLPCRRSDCSVSSTMSGDRVFHLLYPSTER